MAASATDCGAVLTSKGGTVFSGLKLSDLSILYFMGLSICWVISLPVIGQNNAVLPITLLALPITFYSVFYQYRVIKKWCTLCLGVVAILWFQGGSLFLKESLITNLRFDFAESFTPFSLLSDRNDYMDDP